MKKDAKENISDKKTTKSKKTDKKSSFSVLELQQSTLVQLHELAKNLDIQDYKQLKKNDLIFKMLQAKTKNNDVIYARGVLEILSEGYGFLRTNNYLPSSEDIYVSQTQIRKFGLCVGDTVAGEIRPPKMMNAIFLY